VNVVSVFISLSCPWYPVRGHSFHIPDLHWSVHIMYLQLMVSRHSIISKIWILKNDNNIYLYIQNTSNYRRYGNVHRTKPLWNAIRFHGINLHNHDFHQQLRIDPLISLLSTSESLQSAQLVIRVSTPNFAVRIVIDGISFHALLVRDFAEKLTTLGKLFVKY
jgi:hypothetical protein